jgi:hypothetical protein
MSTLTLEQEIQTAIKAAVNAALTAAKISCAVSGIKIDGTGSEGVEAVYPVIVINTSTPVPMGHKSDIIDVPLWITVMTYMPEDRRRSMFAKLCEIVFTAIHLTFDWDQYTPASNRAEISSVMITAGEEPSVMGEILQQVTNAVIAARIKQVD